MDLTHIRFFTMLTLLPIHLWKPKSRRAPVVAAGTSSETVNGRRVCKPSAAKGLSISAMAAVWLASEATHSHPLQDPVVWRTLHLGGYFHQLLQVPKKHLHSTHTESQNYVEDSTAWNARCQEKTERKDESLSVT